MTPHALIFDLDGVIADTVRAHEAGWSLVAAELGIALTPEMLASFRGKRRADILRTITGRELSDAEMAAVMPTKTSHYDDFLASLNDDHILPGVEMLIEAGRKRGLGLAVASSSYNARVVLTKLGLLERFDVIADGLTVFRAKPHPDIFIWAAGALRVRPVDCVVFEDANAGVTAALEAGMRVVGVGDPSIVGRAHIVVPDLAGFDLDSL